MKTAEDILKTILENAVHTGGGDYRINEKYLNQARELMEAPAVHKPVIVYCDRELTGTEEKILPAFITFNTGKGLFKYQFKALNTVEVIELTEKLPAEAVVFMKIGNGVYQIPQEMEEKDTDINSIDWQGTFSYKADNK